LERIAGIILAAGGARRYGSPKLLLDWQGQPFVRQVASTALSAGLSPVVLVSGAEAEAVQGAVAGLALLVVHNAVWEKGQSGSLQTGLRALPDEVGAAVFLLADQPQIPVELILALLKKYSETGLPVIMPRSRERRGNPVLFARPAFNDLLTLEGDVGGRAILERYEIGEVIWEDPLFLLDVDTPEDYQRLLSKKMSG
jgi:molybdenum cofactor cytidylyltransferase